MSFARFVAIMLAAGYGGLIAAWLSTVNELGTVKHLILAASFGTLLSLVVYVCRNDQL